MKNCIITTTINPPKNMEAWERQLKPGDGIVVAGDMKTPHEPWDTWENEQDGVYRRYLSPDEQIEWACSQTIGWNSIQRRNIALLYAMCQRPEFITTIDDDNFPVSSNWFDSLPQSEWVWATGSGWYNPGLMCVPPVRHRGLPFGMQNFTNLTATKNTATNIGVWASLWLDDPDIDAMERIVNDPQIKNITHDVILDYGTWAPFNSQSTTYRAELAPIMAVLPHVGRMDDIWMSYIARAIMDRIGYRVCYGEPLVRQERNSHDLLADLKGEMIGYEHTFEFTEHLRRWSQAVTITGQDLPTLYEMATYNLGSLDWFPRKTIDFIRAWTRDVRQAR